MDQNKETITIDGQEIPVVKEDTGLPSTHQQINFQEFRIEDFINVLVLLRQKLRTVSTVPNYVPRHFLEQVVLYSSGGVNRLYVYMNNKWCMFATNKARGIYMFIGTASDISGYKVLKSIDIYTPSTIASVTASVGTTPTLIQSWATESGYPNTTIIPVGTMSVHVEVQRITGPNNYYVYAEIYKRTSGGTETLITTTDNSNDITNNNLNQITLSAFTSSNVTLSATDRLVVKVYGSFYTASGSIAISYDDNTTSRLEVDYYAQ